MHTAMILAAGRGERMRPLTDTTPKPLLTAGGKPLMVYHIERLVSLGIRHIVPNHAWLGEKIESFLGDGSRYGARIEYSPEEPGGLETLGGLRHALPLLGEDPILAVNGDVYTEYDFGSLIDLPMEDRAGHLVLVSNPPHHPKGDFSLDESGRVQDVPEYTFSGIAVYRTDFFREIPDVRAPLRPFFQKLIREGRLTGEITSAFWCDVGTPERLKNLDERLRSRLENADLKSAEEDR